jgi:hypothetical protein
MIASLQRTIQSGEARSNTTHGFMQLALFAQVASLTRALTAVQSQLSMLESKHRLLQRENSNFSDSKRIAELEVCAASARHVPP